MDFTEVINNIVNNFGILGLLIVSLVVIMVFVLPKVLPNMFDKILFKNNTQLTADINKGLADFADKVTDKLSEQNNTLIASLQNSQNRLLDNQMNMISYMMNATKAQHDAGLDQRGEVLQQLKPILKRLMNGTKARRVAVIEFHNSKTNIEGLPFMWYDIQAEFFRKGESSITSEVKDLQAFTLIDVIKTVNKTKGHVCWYDKNGLDNLADESPILYDFLVNKLNAQTVAYVGLYNQFNKLIGLLVFEFDFDYHYSEVTELQYKQVMQVSIQIENLLSLVPLDKNGIII